MKRLISIILLSIAYTAMYAQIGYQVALLNHANGEPRRNETVSIKVDITDSTDHVIYSQTQNATTNDFGLISLNIGNETTFKDVDWSKLPLFISATVDGVMVGKSQILNVPVAEYALKAKHIEGTVSHEDLLGTWKCVVDEGSSSYTETYTFNNDGTVHCTYTNTDPYGIPPKDYTVPFYMDMFGKIAFKSHRSKDEWDMFHIIKISDDEIIFAQERCIFLKRQ